MKSIFLLNIVMFDFFRKSKNLQGNFLVCYDSANFPRMRIASVASIDREVGNRRINIIIKQCSWFWLSVNTSYTIKNYKRILSSANESSIEYFHHLSSCLTWKGFFFFLCYMVVIWFRPFLDCDIGITYQIWLKSLK